MVEGIEDGGGGGAVDRDEEGEEGEILNAAEGNEGHGCVGEGEGADSVDDVTGGLRDVVGDGIASALGLGEMMGTACGLGVGEMMGTACGLGVEEVVGG